jgi:hypothetical protein
MSKEDYEWEKEMEDCHRECAEIEDNAERVMRILELTLWKKAIATGGDVIGEEFAYVWMEFAFKGTEIEARCPNRKSWPKEKDENGNFLHFLPQELSSDDELTTTWIQGYYGRSGMIEFCLRNDINPGDRVLFRLEKPHWYSLGDDWDASYQWTTIHHVRVRPRIAKHRWLAIHRFTLSDRRRREKLRRQINKAIRAQTHRLCIRIQHYGDFWEKSIFARVDSEAVYNGHRVGDWLTRVNDKEGKMPREDLIALLAKETHENHPYWPEEMIRNLPVKRF